MDRNSLFKKWREGLYLFIAIVILNCGDGVLQDIIQRRIPHWLQYHVWLASIVLVGPVICFTIIRFLRPTEEEKRAAEREDRLA